MKKLIIIGASGQGKVVADIARLNGYEEIVFLDDNPNVHSCLGYPVLGPNSILEDVAGDVFVAIGNSKIRKELMEQYGDRCFATLVHPNAVIAEGVKIGNGSVVMAGAIVCPEVEIGIGCILNTACSVDHDCIIGNYCHVAVGTHLCGTVTVGSGTWVGAGAIISNNIDICKNVMIGAGAVVVKNIDKNGKYVGVPAKIMHSDVEIRGESPED